METTKNYEKAKAQYAKWGIDTDQVLKTLKDIKVSIHCWQGDDITGFESQKNNLSGGISVTGDYFGKARCAEELRNDLEKAMSLIPGKHKVNLHAIYAETNKDTKRSELEPKHFANWVEWAKKQDIGLDFNPTIFAHPMLKDGLSLSSPDETIRNYWIKHVIACRRISEYMGKETKQACVMNLWIPDGYKDIPADRLGPRMRLKQSLDEIFIEKAHYHYDCVESKVFGIGAESYTVGSSEFYLNYAAKSSVLPLMDTGHYHPTEVVSDKVSAMLPFYDKIALHVSRPVRWDSDHVVIFDDELKELAKEIVRNNALDQVMIGLDFFDASINRIAAWVIGTRNMVKALLFALLQPNEYLKQCQDDGDFTTRLAIMEEMKTYPIGDIWDYYCEMMGVPIREAWLEDVRAYETDVLSERG